MHLNGRAIIGMGGKRKMMNGRKPDVNNNNNNPLDGWKANRHITKTHTAEQRLWDEPDVTVHRQ